MSNKFLRRLCLLAACASVALLSACGSGTISSQLVPARFVSFGTAFSDLGQKGSKYTVKDGSANIWVEELAANFGQSIRLSGAGGTSYAQGNARVILKPDAAQNASTPTVKEQIDAFLARDKFGANDVVTIEGGVSDIIFQMNATLSGAQTAAQMTANLQQAGRDLGDQVRRLVQSGARYVVLTGAYNLGRTPWATRFAQTATLSDAMIKFNEALLVSVVDLGGNVLYIDAGFYYNLVTGSPGTYSLTDATSVMCTSIDAGNNIGAGTNQVNSALCTTGTILNALNYNLYFFADQIYPTPAAHRLFGDYAFTRMRARW